MLQVVTCVALILSGIGLCRGADKKPDELKGWGTVVDPANDCKFVDENGKLTITVPGTHHDLNPTPAFDNVLAPRVLQDSEGDFTIQVKVGTFDRPTAKTASSKANISFVGAGLLVWQDEKNFVRLLRAANGDRGDLFGHLEVYRDGKMVGGGYARGIPDKATYLMLSRKGDTFSFAVSEDGEKWTEIKGQDIGLSKRLKVGVAVTNATNKEFAPQFESLSLKGK